MTSVTEDVEAAGAVVAALGIVVVNKVVTSVVPRSYTDVMLAIDVVLIAKVVESSGEIGASVSEAVGSLPGAVACLVVSFSSGSWGSLRLRS